MMTLFDADSQVSRDFFAGKADEDTSRRCSMKKVLCTQITDMPREFDSINHLGSGAKPQSASTTVAAATAVRRAFYGVPRMLPQSGAALLALLTVFSLSIQACALRRVLKGQGPHILAAHMLESRVMLTVARHKVLNVFASLLDHVERGSVDDHRVASGLSYFALVEVVARRNWLVGAQGVPEGLPVLAHTLGPLGESAVGHFDIGVSSGAIALVLYRFRVDLWFLESLVELLVLQIREEKRGWVVLWPRLLHLGEATVIVVDVGIATSAIGLVNDSTVALHILAIEISRS